VTSQQVRGRDSAAVFVAVRYRLTRLAAKHNLTFDPVTITLWIPVTAAVGAWLVN